jgi:hypothetical protein
LLTVAAWLALFAKLFATLCATLCPARLGDKLVLLDAPPLFEAPPLTELLLVTLVLTDATNETPPLPLTLPVTDPLLLLVLLFVPEFDTVLETEIGFDTESLPVTPTAAFTTIVPVIMVWILQRYGNVPSPMEAMLRLKVAGGAKFPEFHTPVVEETV